ncbi:hypothetical protein CYMTET_48977 [Cymbomonas tetramitiformis]|uniref:Uncharacterized protein n=1 Tax=Cymbomonas tetramitiformis TaxID=36881 RepID=A0AAE0BR20_9CHLO|nr:hypothetical protein CYMTET_48977 [Cymbomonas tetramitiformis]
MRFDEYGEACGHGAALAQCDAQAAAAQRNVDPIHNGLAQEKKVADSSQDSSKPSEHTALGQRDALPTAAHRDVVPLELAALAQCDAQPTAAQRSNETPNLITLRSDIYASAN